MPPQKPINSPGIRRKSPKNSSKPEENGEEGKKAKAEKQRLARNARASADQRASHAKLSQADKWLKRWRQEASPPTPRAGSLRSLDPRKVALAEGFCYWSDLDEVVRTYIACAVMNELGLGQYVVDHIIPLRGIGDLVRGLHTHTNLQVITHAENKRKGNWIWPGMSAVTTDTLLLMQR